MFSYIDAMLWLRDKAEYVTIVGNMAILKESVQNVSAITVDNMAIYNLTAQEEADVLSQDFQDKNHKDVQKKHLKEEV